MSQLVLDDQLDVQVVVPPLQRRVSVQLLRELRPKELIPDDRIPEILLTVKKPTFITIDQDFWDRRLCHPDYCILFFALRDDQQEHLAMMLRELFKQRGFSTRKARMGKVARIGPDRIEFYQFGNIPLTQLDWPIPIQKRWKK